MCYRIARTYDDFIRNLAIEQQQHELAIAANIPHSSVASNGRKRKHTDNDDENQSSHGSDDTVVGKRARTNDVVATSDAAATASVTDDDDADQNRNNFDNIITDDNSGSDHTEQAAQHNGQQRIGSDEAFNQGYVVVIPSMNPHQIHLISLILNFILFQILRVYDHCSEIDGWT